MAFKKIILLCILSTATTSCALWPYKKDFDCPVTEGMICKSLHEISEMADQGIFATGAIKDKEFKNKKQKALSAKKELLNNAN